MNDRYKELKKQYDDIGKQISELHAEKRAILEQMKEVCSHENLDRLTPNPFLVDRGIEDSEIRYKCRDCFDYFSEDEIKKRE